MEHFTKVAVTGNAKSKAKAKKKAVPKAVTKAAPKAKAKAAPKAKAKAAPKTVAKKTPAVKKEAVTKAPRAKSVIQNNVRKPLSLESKTGRVWAICDELNSKKRIPTITEVSTQGVSEGINTATIRTQYSAWRTFYGHAAIWNGVKEEAA